MFDSLAAKCIFVVAAGSAPVRALACQELVTTVSMEYILIDGNVGRLMVWHAQCLHGNKRGQ
eukprot:4459727-Amphidinium_carterae.1